MAHLQMVYLLKIVIFHGYVSHNQMVSTVSLLVLDGEVRANPRRWCKGKTRPTLMSIRLSPCILSGYTVWIWNESINQYWVYLIYLLLMYTGGVIHFDGTNQYKSILSIPVGKWSRIGLEVKNHQDVLQGFSFHVQFVFPYPVSSTWEMVAGCPKVSAARAPICAMLGTRWPRFGKTIPWFELHLWESWDIGMLVNNTELRAIPSTIFLSVPRLPSIWCNLFPWSILDAGMVFWRLFQWWYPRISQLYHQFIRDFDLYWCINPLWC